uniref:ND6 protein n=1 Tax=Pupa strigosa TaxID=96460 RepID=Q9T9G7_9GAST|nr:NADH dehydrogenase subunit 6 [Pupa strigosa]BAA89016.1 ND6 [Pupa strigosa]
MSSLLKFLCLFVLAISLLLPLYKDPISMAVLVIFLSFGMIAVMGHISSQWYPYVFFLVYIGGLLVMFIYVCLVSSNYPFRVSPAGLTSSGLLTLFLFANMFQLDASSKMISGKLGSGSGLSLVTDSSLGMFLALGVLLLAMLLVVVRVIGSGTIFMGNESL